MNLDHANPPLFAALSAAQLEIENATKASVNPHFKNRYADLAEVLNTVRPVLARHGLSLMQSTALAGEYVSVTTVLGHKEGGYITSVASCVPLKYDAQGIGSATTYLRRYSLAAMSGISQEDDDGSAAAHSRPKQQSRALVDVLAKIEAATCREELDAIKPAIKELTASERTVAIDAGMRKSATVKPIATEEEAA